MLMIILLFLFITHPSHVLIQTTISNSEKITVLVFLKPNINIDYVNIIKQRFYSQISSISDWTQIDSLLNKMRREIYSWLSHVLEPYYLEISNLVKSLNGKILSEIRSIAALSVELPLNNLKYLKNSPLVANVEPTRWYKVTLNIAAPSIFADVWWNNGYNGSNYGGDNIRGIEVAVLDTGIDLDHPYLADRIIDSRDFSDDGTPEDLFGHGTMVAGIIASNEETYRGIAFRANLINAKCMNKDGQGRSDWILSALEWAVTEAVDTAEIINTSFGTTEEDPNGESSFTRALDALIDLYDISWATAAGNWNDQTEYQLNVPGDNYNGITVGAISDKNTIDRSDDEWASFSCTGPTSDKRVKPDVVAPGDGIVSTKVGGELGIGWGTSLSTPMVSGALALMAPLYIPMFGSRWPLVAKAQIINSADDWFISGPDNRTGWGYINLNNSWEWRLNVDSGEITTDENVSYTVYIEKGDVFKITLVWNRRFPSGVIVPYSLSQLRILLYDYEGNLLAQTKNTPDNAQQLVFISTKSDLYRVVIKAEYIDPQLGTEYYAIASNLPLIKGVLARDLLINLEAPSRCLDSEKIIVNITVTNIGNHTLPYVGVNLTISTGLELLNATNHFDITDLSPNASVHLRIIAKPLSLGDQFIRAEAYYEANGEISRAVIMKHIVVIDDDENKPLIRIFGINGTGIIFTNLIIYADVFDPSGISRVLVYYKVGKNVSQEDYDGLIELQYDESTGYFIGHLRVQISWVGKSIHFALIAYDGDEDRPNDEEYSWSPELVFDIPTTPNFVILGSLILLILIGVIIFVRGIRRR